MLGGGSAEEGFTGKSTDGLYVRGLRELSVEPYDIMAMFTFQC
jgi:hypothetical protein